MADAAPALTWECQEKQHEKCGDDNCECVCHYAAKPVPTTVGLRSFLAWSGNVIQTQTRTAELISLEAGKIQEGAGVTMAQLNHILRQQRRPTLLQACAIQRLTEIPCEDWLK